MRKVFNILLLGMVLLWFCVPVYAGESKEVETFYKAITPDYESESIAQVKVESSTVWIVKESYTLEEIDYYIELYHSQLKAVQANLEKAIELRNSIEAEASKVKLKDGKPL